MLELSAFIELNPNELPYDNWPTCDLYDAVVWSPKSTHPNHLIDLLDVLEKGPFNVRGKIRKIPDELKQYIRSPKNAHLITGEFQVANVRRWSIERLADESIVIWALGNAAWYGIHPADEYREIYNVMLQKAAIYNFIFDKFGHLNARSKQVKTSMGDLFKEMSTDPALGAPKNVEKLVQTHRRFIMAQLIEHSKFKKTPFWAYFEKQYEGEIEEVQAVKRKVELEISAQEDKKAKRLAKPSSPKESAPPERRHTRARSGTASSGTSENGTSSKRKSRDHSTEEPGPRRRKTNADESSKPKSHVWLGQKSRRSNRIPNSSSPTPEAPLEPPKLSLEKPEKVTLAGRTTRSARSSIPSSVSPTSSHFPTKSAASASTAPSSVKDKKETEVQAVPPIATIKPEVPKPPPVQEAPPPPKPSLDVLKEVINHKSPVKKTNAVPANRLLRRPGQPPTPVKKSRSPPTKKLTRSAGTVPQTTADEQVVKVVKKGRKKTSSPVVPVVPLDENHPGYDDIRDQAISKLTEMHSLYQKISHSTSQPEYEKYVDLVDENAEWRRQHGLKAIYIDVLYAASRYTDEVTDSTLIRRVPGTEYLVDRSEWDFDMAVELLQNVNRGTYVQELLQPVKEARRNARLRGGKAGRGRPRKHPVAEEVTSTLTLSGLKISAVPNGESVKANEAAAAVDVKWECSGHDDKGNKCDFVVEDGTSLEGAKKASDHWRTCPLRMLATEECLVKKRDNVAQAQTEVRDQQIRDPWTNIDRLVNWIEGESKKTWFPAGVC